MPKELAKKFKSVATEVTPRAEWKSTTRELLLSQINPHQEKSIGVGIFGYVNFGLSMMRGNVLQPAVMMLVVLGTFVGSGLTINAAYYSLPGEALYPVKLSLEHTHVALVSNEERKVELKVEFAQKRVDEFEKVAARNDIDPEVKKQHLQTVAMEFKNNVAGVNQELIKINQSIKTDTTATTQQKTQTVTAALTASTKTQELTNMLDAKIELLLESEKQEVKEIAAQARTSVEETTNATLELQGHIGPSATGTPSVTAQGGASATTTEGTPGKSIVEPAETQN